MTVRLVALAVLDLAAVALAAMAGAAGWGLAGHALASGAGYAIWLHTAEDKGFAAAIGGVLGPVGLLVGRPFDRRSRPAASHAAFDPATPSRTSSGAGPSVARMLDGRIHHAAPETLGSLVTILRHGDIVARRRALETVVRSFEPSLSPLIAQALTDGDQTIRALAAAASARVAQNLALARSGESAGPAATATLAALLADHARADVLLSDSQRGHLREDAVALAPEGIALQVEAAWAAGDYATIDRLAAAEDAPDDVARWWRSEATA
ncbi:hypothetical protein M9979_03520 [Sphingomonas sp. RP10(2022)]|uniref:HEAT repeat domain-containing protein n=1 Tax=Sphingomonas liriopis TaxID=2949094 RepID=A0A9X2HMX6_9SPHN|nr:hypothetical protein [Sphingomonas liriopis]MCP3733943.1 hypothetical protein [Sphingomonas liriopis]